MREEQKSCEYCGRSLIYCDAWRYGAGRLEDHGWLLRLIYWIWEDEDNGD